MVINLESYLFLSLVLFFLGVVIALAKKTVLGVLIGLELIVNAAALNFVAFSTYRTGQIDGQLFTLFIIVVAAAEAAIAFAMAVRFFQTRDSVHLDDACELQN